MNSEELMAKAQEWIALYGLKLVAAILILVIGRIVAKLIKKLITRLMERGNVDKTLIAFTVNLVYALLMTFVIIAALGQLGVQTASFVAIIGAAGLAVGLALQGSLSNFAAGVLMIIFKPFKVGDFIDAAGTAGIVEEIGIFTTQLKTPDNKQIIIPNSSVTGGNITNFSAKETRRVDFVFGVGYGDDLKKVKQVLQDIVDADERILKDPAPTIGLLELGDSSVNFAVRPWVKGADYWAVYFDIMEQVKVRFDEEGITIPFPPVPGVGIRHLNR